MNRRTVLLASGVTLSTALAGCSGDTDENSDGNGTGNGNETEPENGTENSTESETANSDEDGEEESGNEDVDDVEAVVGSLVEGENIHLVVEDTETTTQIGDFQEADSGTEYLIATLAMKNVSEDFINVSQLLQTSVRDDEGYSYTQSLAVTDQPSFDGGQFVPGEVERGTIVFELPQDATGRTLEFDFDVDLIGGVNRAEIDLEDETGVHTLEQDLAIDVHDVGETVGFSDVSVTVNGVEFESELGRYTQPDEGNEYAIVDISIENNSGEEQSVSTMLQMLVKDGAGWSYQEDLMAASQLDRAFDEGLPLSDGETRRGQLAYEVEQGLHSLYWVFEFSLWTEGDKTFWRLR